jgi:hypothetical protein
LRFVPNLQERHLEMELDRELAAMRAVLTALEPLESEERARVIGWAVQKLGISGQPIPRSNAKGIDSGVPGATPVNLTLPISSKGGLWMRQNELTEAEILEVFHFEDSGGDIILGEIPGPTTRDKVRNAYLLLGLSNYLVNGTPTIGDKAGRSACERFGIYDRTNHSKSFKGQNELTGSSKSGWTVTAPGLRRAATLIKQSSSAND